MVMKTLKGDDPRWMVAVGRSHCLRCGRTIKPGQKVLVFLGSGSVFCDRRKCGKAEESRWKAKATAKAMIDKGVM